jgi:hypothetical protein
VRDLSIQHSYLPTNFYDTGIKNIIHTGYQTNTSNRSTIKTNALHKLVGGGVVSLFSDDYLMEDGCFHEKIVVLNEEYGKSFNVDGIAKKNNAEIVILVKFNLLGINKNLWNNHNTKVGEVHRVYSGPENVKRYRAILFVEFSPVRSLNLVGNIYRWQDTRTESIKDDYIFKQLSFGHQIHELNIPFDIDLPDMNGSQITKTDFQFMIKQNNFAINTDVSEIADIITKLRNFDF